MDVGFFFQLRSYVVDQVGKYDVTKVAASSFSDTFELLVEWIWKVFVNLSRCRLSVLDYKRIDLQIGPLRISNFVSSRLVSI